MYVTDTKMPYFRGKLVGGNRSSGRSGGIAPQYKDRMRSSGRSGCIIP